MKQAESGHIQALNEPVISENANENENNQNSVTDAVARDEICLSKSRSNVRSVISQISDINSEEESFHSNPSSSSFTSTITSNMRTRRTAATATAAAYTKKIN